MGFGAGAGFWDDDGMVDSQQQAPYIRLSPDNEPPTPASALTTSPSADSMKT